MGSNSTRYWQKGFGRKSFKFQDFNEMKWQNPLFMEKIKIEHVTLFSS
jgi:hypothetical protein